MAELQWLHSGGSFNKDPAKDLGGFPSKFKISGGQPPLSNIMNNLFDDVTPEEASFGITDYRCFYIWNPSPTIAIENSTVAITSECDCGAEINFGSTLIDDVQIIHIDCKETTPDEPPDEPTTIPTPTPTPTPTPPDDTGPLNGPPADGFAPLYMFDPNSPDENGFVIFDTEFGPPFTVYWQGSFAQFGTDIQSAINSLPWCTGVTVTGSNPYTVTFKAEVGNRNVQLIRVVQNNLLIKGVGRYNTVTYSSDDSWNGYNDSEVKTVYPISEYVKPSGDLRIYNPLTGLWDIYPYGSFSDDTFSLSKPLEFNMVGYQGYVPPYGDVNDPQNWQRDFPSPETDTKLATPWGVVEAPILDKNCQVCIYKKTQGSPINTYAKPIKIDTDTPVDPDNPSDTVLDMNSKYIGNLKPNEGFYLWVERIIQSEADPCLKIDFSIKLTATAVSWPLSPP